VSEVQEQIVVEQSIDQVPSEPIDLGEQQGQEPVDQAPADPYADIEDVQQIREMLRQKDVEVQKFKTMTEQQERFIQQKKQQLGDSDKRKRELEQANVELLEAQKKAEEAREQVYENPDAYADAKYEVLSRQKEILTKQHAMNESVVLSVHSDFKDLLQVGIPEVLKNEGFTEQHVQQFRDNWRLDPQTAVFYADKARMYREKLELQKELERVKQGKSDIADKIMNAATLSSPIIGNANPKSYAKPIESMTPQEIEAEYRELMKKGQVTALRK